MHISYLRVYQIVVKTSKAGDEGGCYNCDKVTKKAGDKGGCYNCDKVTNMMV